MTQIQKPRGSLVQITATGVRASYETPNDGKLAIKELRIRKREFSLQKREVNDRMKAIRAQYTHEVRSRGKMVRGGGKIGRVARVFQSAARDERRAKLARDLAPLEREKFRIEAMINAIDSLILQVQTDILRAA